MCSNLALIGSAQPVTDFHMSLSRHGRSLVRQLDGQCPDIASHYPDMVGLLLRCCCPLFMHHFADMVSYCPDMIIAITKICWPLFKHG